jgi:hypothetical protein
MFIIFESRFTCFDRTNVLHCIKMVLLGLVPEVCCCLETVGLLLVSMSYIKVRNCLFVKLEVETLSRWDIVRWDNVQWDIVRWDIVPAPCFIPITTFWDPDWIKVMWLGICSIVHLATDNTIIYEISVVRSLIQLYFILNKCYWFCTGWPAPRHLIVCFLIVLFQDHSC